LRARIAPCYPAAMTTLRNIRICCITR